MSETKKLISNLLEIGKFARAWLSSDLVSLAVRRDDLWVGITINEIIHILEQQEPDKIIDGIKYCGRCLVGVEQQPLPDEELVEKIIKAMFSVNLHCVDAREEVERRVRELLKQRQPKPLPDEELVHIKNLVHVKKWLNMVKIARNTEHLNISPQAHGLINDAEMIIRTLLQQRQPGKPKITREELKKLLPNLCFPDALDVLAEFFKSKGFRMKE